MKMARLHSELTEFNSGYKNAVNDFLSLIDSTQEEPTPKAKFKVGQTIRYIGDFTIYPEVFTISEITDTQYWDKNGCIVPIKHQDQWELVEEPISEDFKQFEEVYLEKEKDEILCVYDRHAGLVDGAKWQKEQDKQWLAENHKHIFAEGRESMKVQMMKISMNGVICYFQKKVHLIQYSRQEAANVLSKFNHGDKVKLIIIKDNSV